MSPIHASPQTGSDPVLLLDIGNVVLGVDFRRVFVSWAASAGVDSARFYQGWQMDAAYRAHEVGEIDFATYCQALSGRFDIELPVEQWLIGWNDLWTEPFHDVIALLPALAEHFRLYAFSNTNPSHEDHFRERFGSELEVFEHVYTSPAIGQRKPDPQAYLAVCRDIDVAPERVVFIDDTQENVAGAVQAGLVAHHCDSERAVVSCLRGLLKQIE